MTFVDAYRIAQSFHWTGVTADADRIRFVRAQLASEDQREDRTRFWVFPLRDDRMVERAYCRLLGQWIAAQGMTGEEAQDFAKSMLYGHYYDKKYKRLARLFRRMARREVQRASEYWQ